MSIVKQQQLYKGKAKTLYATNDASKLVVSFRDDATAFDGEKKAVLANKGIINQQISNHLMTLLQENDIPTHFIEQISATESIIKHLKMLPIECVVRNYAAGSLCRRLGMQSGVKLVRPLFELFYKNDELHDPLINEEHVLLFQWADEQQLEAMKTYSMTINEILAKRFMEIGLLLIDAKYEFGVYDGAVILGDEISPDSCRLWDSQTLKPLDKDRFRHDMGEVISSYREIAERLNVGGVIIS